MTDQTVQIGVRGSFYVQVTSAQVVDGFIVDHEGAVGVLQRGMRGQDRVVGFYYSGGHLWSGIDGELQFGLFAVVDTQALHQQGREAGPGAAPEAVKDEETLETCTLVGQLADSVQNEIYNFLAYGVVTTSIVVGGVLLACDELLRMEKLAVCSGTNFIWKIDRRNLV